MVATGGERGGGERALARFFRGVVARRRAIAVLYLLLLAPAIVLALRVGQDNSLDRLIVQSDPEARTAREFAAVFGSGEYAILLAEAPDPFAPDALARLDRLERALSAIPHVEPNSLLAIYRRARGGFDPAKDGAALRRFAEGTPLFARQGLVGPGFLSIPVVIDAPDAAARRATVGALAAAAEQFDHDRGPFTVLRRAGQPFVNDYLDRDTARASARYFPLFGLFVVVINLFLYRSWRALSAFLATLVACLALTMGFIGATGGSLTIVSPLVPMTVLITCTATLVYLHSRFVEHPEGRPVEEHRIFSLCNKFVACTASIFATAAGFAALAVSGIRPIRDMGLWVAGGLLITFVTVFTLFPALQALFNAPTRLERRVAGGAGLERLAAVLPEWSYRWRWPLVLGALALSAAGAVALFGWPGRLAPMRLETRAVDYIPHGSQLYKDTKRLEEAVSGLSLTEVWLAGPPTSLADPAVLAALERLSRSIERCTGVTSVIGPTTVLRLVRYTGGHGDAFPDDPAALDKLAADLELLLPTEPLLARFVEPKEMGQTHFAVVSRADDYEGFHALEAALKDAWARAAAGEPALRGFSMRLAGVAPLQAKIAHHLVPTLVESFVLTVAIIFGAFLLVFRSGAARLMAMIPSLFAILVMFLVMRLSGMTLNVATILIASTVLGTSENDQIHFFYHFIEGRRAAPTAAALRHAFVIAGRAILFATLINAGGFLAFAIADLPPMRQFGLLSALAFALSMLADFTALPAALWLVFRERPGAECRQ